MAWADASHLSSHWTCIGSSGQEFPVMIPFLYVIEATWTYEASVRPGSPEPFPEAARVDQAGTLQTQASRKYQEFQGVLFCFVF